MITVMNMTPMHAAMSRSKRRKPPNQASSTPAALCTAPQTILAVP